jgi:S-DNA-T family DNA segregation ATPase FtsK/SpoIIIE
VRFEIPDERIVDVDLSPGTTLGELLGAIDGRRELLIEGERVDPGQPVGAVWDGSCLGEAGTEGGVVELVGVAGLDAGGRWLLGPGGFELAGSDGQIVHVSADGSISVGPRGGGGRSIARGETFKMGDTTWRVATPRPYARRPEPIAGRRSFNRPPRHLPPNTVQAIVAPEPPEEPVARARMGLAMLVGPVLVGAIMAVVFRPIMAVIALVGPLMMGMSWGEDRMRIRRVRRGNAVAWTAALENFESELQRSARAERDQVARRHPEIPDAIRVAVEMQSTLWERRSHHPDYLCATVGSGRTEWSPPVQDSRDRLDPVVSEAIERHHWLPVGPVELDLRAGSMLGIAGDRRGALALVSALVLRLSIYHGPADWRVAVLTDSVPDWEWSSWLPHARVDALSGRYRLASNPDDVESVLASFADAGESDDMLVIVDSAGVTPAQRSRLAALIDSGKMAGIVVENLAEALPGSCGVVITVRGASGLLDRPGSPDSPIPFVIDGVQPDTAAFAARHLFGLDDPEEENEGARLPSELSLASVAGGHPEERDLLDGWTHPPAGLRATVGVTENGPLTLDLVADGPHGLIAGTTGSGKSEFLRSLIGSLAAAYGPDRVTFALIDYKGGSAFDACAGLPHLVGLVTDLDQQLGERALRSLNAELRHREEALRRVGADSIVEYRDLDRSSPMPRLVVIIDEFAALAAALPDFVSSLVDIAQRGRSLGIHLILATQRPAGVVGDAIRANTNLRIALRVQSAADSSDVIDDPVAARLPRRSPGRGFVRLGPGELVAFQAAHSTIVEGVRPSSPPVRRVRFGWEPVGPETDVESIEGPTDLQRIVESASAAVDRLGWSSPRPAWAPPFPEVVALGDGPTADRMIGLVDEPDLQRIGELAWRPDDGGLLAFGVADSGALDALFAAAFAAALARSPDDLHIYGIDGGAGQLAGMAGWPHVGDVVRVADHERIGRTIRKLSALLDERRHGVWSGPMVLVVIERLEVVLGAFEGPGDIAVREMLSRVVVDGPAFGILPLLSAARPGGVPPAISGSIGRRLCFRLADPFEYAAAGLAVRRVPELGRGRGFDSSGRLVQIGTPSESALAKLAGTGPSVNRPVSIGRLPDRVPLAAVSGLSSVVDGGRFVPVGIGDTDLAPIGLRLHAGDHVLVAGPARSGRTTTLATIARLAAAGDPDLSVVAVVRGKSVLSDAVETTCRTIDDLVEVVESGQKPLLVVIDDAERVDHPDLAALLDRHDDGLHVIAAGRADALRGLYQHWTRGLRRCRLGISLRPQVDVDGELWQTQFPRRGPSFHQPGRGYLVSGGDLEIVQVAAS